jgi:hypothetical protein
MAAILLHGRIAFNDIIKVIDTSYYEISALRETMIQMVHDQFLKSASPQSSQATLDLRLKRESETLAALGVLPTAKDLKAWESTRESQALEELENPIQVGMVRVEFWLYDFFHHFAVS